MSNTTEMKSINDSNKGSNSSFAGSSSVWTLETIEVDDEKMKAFVTKKVNDEIKGSLTVLREDNDLKPFTKKQIQAFVKKNQDVINEIVDDVLLFIEEENEDYKTMSDDAYRECLFTKLPELITFD